MKEPREFDAKKEVSNMDVVLYDTRVSDSVSEISLERSEESSWNFQGVSEGPNGLQCKG